jgi:hypothetical protein
MTESRSISVIGSAILCVGGAQKRALLRVLVCVGRVSSLPAADGGRLWRARCERRRAVGGAAARGVGREARGRGCQRRSCTPRAGPRPHVQELAGLADGEA